MTWSNRGTTWIRTRRDVRATGTGDTVSDPRGIFQLSLRDGRMQKASSGL